MAAVTTAVAAGVAAVATVGQAVVGYQKSKEQENTLETLQDKNKQKAADILTQIDAEQAILDEDLEALQKQSDFAVKKVLGQTTTQMDTTQDQITDAKLSSYVSSSLALVLFCFLIVV